MSDQQSSQEAEVVNEMKEFSDGLAAGMSSAFSAMVVLIYPENTENPRVAFPFSINRVAISCVFFDISHDVLQMGVAMIRQHDGGVSKGLADVSGLSLKARIELCDKLLKRIYSDARTIVLSEILAEVRGK